MKAIIVYGDLECLFKKMPSCKNNPKNSYTEKKVKHKSSGYAWCSICLFDDTKNRRYFYRRKDGIEKFCKEKYTRKIYYFFSAA